MPKFPKPSEGSWTEHYPGLGTGPVSYEDSISREFYEKEQQAVFQKAWLNIGRVEQLPRTGSYFTRELTWAKRSILVVKGKDGVVRAFHNICRHRGNKLVWDDYPNEETSGTCRQFTCKYHAWRFDLDGTLNFVQQESEFFDLDKDDARPRAAWPATCGKASSSSTSPRSPSRRSPSSSARWAPASPATRSAR